MRIADLVVRGSVLAICFALAVRQSPAPLFAPNSLTAMTADADLIVSGSAQSVNESGNAAVITLTAARVIKGDSSVTGSLIVFDWQMPPGGLAPGLNQYFSSLPPHANGLWFLKDSAGKRSLIPLITGFGSLGQDFFPQPPGPLPEPYSYPANASLTDKVAAEVCFALENLTGNGLLRTMFQGPLLDALHSRYSQTLYQRLAGSASEQRHVEGLAGEMREGNTDALRAAIAFASSPASDPALNGVLLFAIANDFRAADPASVAMLGQAALGQAAVSQDLNQPLREAVAHALARIHTQAALPYLATLLDDPDDALRIEAIGGFSLFANGLPVQTSAGTPGLTYLQLPAAGPWKTQDTIAHFAMGQQAISQNEAKYLDFWKAWWSANRAALGG